MTRPLPSPHRSRSRRTAPRPADRHGFTLIEILIAIGIAAVLLGTALVGFQGMREEEALRGPMRELENLVQQARTRAVIDGQPSVVALSPDGASLLDLTPLTAAADLLAQPPLAKVEVPEGATLATRPWGAPDWITPSPPFLWPFRRSGLVVPVRVRITRGDSWIEGSFNPLTADLEEERFYIEP